MAETQAETETQVSLAPVSPHSHLLTDAELWARRFEVIARRSSGEPVYLIAESYSVTPHTIYNDIEAYHQMSQVWANIERGILMVVNHYDHILWKAEKNIERAEKEGNLNVIPNYLREMNKAIYGKAVVYGLIKPEVNNHSSVINVIQPGRWGRRRERVVKKPTNEIEIQSQVVESSPQSSVSVSTPA